MLIEHAVFALIIICSAVAISTSSWAVCVVVFAVTSTLACKKTVTVSSNTGFPTTLVTACLIVSIVVVAATVVVIIVVTANA